MKKFRILLCGLVMLAAFAGTASAIPFSVTHDYAGSGVYASETYLAIMDIFNWFDWHDTFSVSGVDSSMATLDSAYFSITHVGNMSMEGVELWLVTDQSNHNIGALSQSPPQGWTTDTFTLSGDILNTITSSNPWSLAISISEETGWIDTLWVDEATFGGEYTALTGINPHTNPVPEPATLLLLGTGLAGVITFGRKKYNKTN